VFGWGNLKFWEILNSKNFKYFNWNSFIFKILCLDKKIKIMRVKKNEWKKEDMVGVLVIRVPLHSHPIDVLRAQTLFLEEDCKKRISISHLLEENWNSIFLVV